MDVDAFLTAARSPVEWFDKADELRVSGDILWRSYKAEPEWYNKMAALTTCTMVYAMAIEVALKGTLLRQSPDKVSFAIETNGAGEVQFASIKQFGVRNHNLVDLAVSVGLAGADRDGERRKALRQLTECLVWVARYPVPNATKRGTESPGVVPMAIGNREIREIVDEILDELLESYDLE